MNKNVLIVGIASLVLVAAVVFVVAGRGTDRASAAECRGEHPRPGEWSTTEDAGKGLAVFRSTCARCHGYTDDGAFCLRADGDRLLGPVDDLTETTRHDAARIKEIVRSHRAAQNDEGTRSLFAELDDDELDAVAKLVAEIR